MEQQGLTPESVPPAISAGLVPGEHTNVLSMISAASADPNVDPQKLHALFDFYERVKRMEAEAAFNAAMVHVQTVLPPITRHGVILNKNGTVRSRYAKIEDIATVLKPLCAADGLANSFTMAWNAETKLITVVLTIMHVSGWSRPNHFTVPFDRDQYRTAAQDAGSANSFAKRYALVNAYDITVVDEDDDGQNLGAEKITLAQKNQILDLIIASGAIEQGFLDHMNVAKVDDIVQNQFDRAIGLLQLKQRQNERRGAKP